MILDQAVSVLNSPQGGLAYHFAISLAVGLLFAFAQTLSSQRGDRTTFLWTLATALLGATRLGLILVFGISVRIGSETASFLAVVELYLSLAGALALAWAFIAFREDGLGDQIFAGLQALIMLSLLLSLIALAALPLRGEFNSSALGFIWHVAGLMLVIAIILGLILRRTAQWELAGAGFAFLGAGFALQLFLGPQIGSSAGYLRLGEVAAYPILALAGARALGSLLPSGAAMPVGETSTDGLTLTEARDRLQTLQEENDRLLARLLDRGGEGPQLDVRRRPGPEERPVVRISERPALALKGMEDTPEVAKLKGEFKLALQELASLSRALPEDEGDLEGPEPTRPVAFGAVGALSAVIRDMRHTLTSTGSYAELLRLESVAGIDEEQRAFLDRLRSDVQRLTSQVEKLSQLTTERPVAKGPPEGHLDPARIVHGSLAATERMLEEKSLSFALDLQDGLPYLDAPDEDALKLVSAMLENAAAGSPPGKEVRFSAQSQVTETGSWLVLSATDASAGFPPEELSRVLQPGSQHDAVAGGSHPLVPSVAEIRALARRLGGRVWVGSEPGSGTTVTVLLPAGSAAPLAGE